MLAGVRRPDRAAASAGVGDDEVAARIDVAAGDLRLVRVLLQNLAGTQLEFEPVGPLGYFDRVAAVRAGRGVVAAIGADLDRGDLPAGKTRGAAGRGDDARNRAADGLRRSADDGTGMM